MDDAHPPAGVSAAAAASVVLPGATVSVTFSMSHSYQHIRQHRMQDGRCLWTVVCRGYTFVRRVFIDISHGIFVDSDAVSRGVSTALLVFGGHVTTKN